MRCLAGKSLPDGVPYRRTVNRDAFFRAMEKDEAIFAVKVRTRQTWITRV